MSVKFQYKVITLLPNNKLQSTQKSIVHKQKKHEYTQIQLKKHTSCDNRIKYHKFVTAAQTKTQKQIHNQTESEINPNYKQKEIKITI